jgi:AraC-like DNA-binding protein
LLEEACPHCGESMKPLGPYGRPGYCSKCLEWLADKRTPSVDDARGDREAEVEVALWRAKAIGELLAITPRLNWAATVFKANFQTCLRIVAENNACALAQASHLSRTVVAFVEKGRSHLQLDTLLQLCYHLNIPPTAFLENDPGGTAVHWQRAKEAVIKDRERPLSWPPERARRVLREAVREQPPPSLSDIARRLNYKLIERLYQIDGTLAKQIAANYLKSGRSHWWRKPGAARLCERVNIRQVLERSLAQEDPVNVHHIAASLGYTNEGYIQQKFPELCRAIREKCRIRKKVRIARMELALKDAAKAERPPALGEIAKRLGYSNSEILRRYFPARCDKILARRRLFRRQYIQKLRRAVRSALSEWPCPSLTSLCKRIGLCHSYLQKLCPHEWALIRS